MSNDYTKEIGYESLLADFKRYQKQTPRGVGMTRKGQNIYLQFKTPNTSRKPYACNCSFTLDGMVEALKKSKQVKEQLDNLKSEVEFWDWYDKEIKNESQLVDDRLTFGEAIAKVENDFWGRLSRTKQPRSKDNPSDVNSYYEVYGKFYKKLPEASLFDLSSIMTAIDTQEKGTTTYAYAVSAMKKLAGTNKRSAIYDVLDDLNVEITKFRELQSIDLESYFEWRDKVLGKTVELHKNSKLDSRKAWMWVFSVQIVYALRISEVFAIKNLFSPYQTKDGIASVKQN